MPPAATDAIAELRDAWRLPDGTELAEAFEFDRHARTLSVGFFNRWKWPDGKPDVEWLDARRGWAGAVHAAITYGAGPWDSPGRVEAAAREGLISGPLAAAWTAWQRVADRPAPPTEAVWLDGARAWLVGVVRVWLGADRTPGLVWYQSAALGPVLAEAGLPVYGAGTDTPRCYPQSVAVSQRVHGTGANLQAWSRSLVLEPPSAADRWEQLLGRTHRPGQLAPVVICDVLAAAWPTRRAVEEAIARTECLRTLGGIDDPKLSVCDWLPPLVGDDTVYTQTEAA